MKTRKMSSLTIMMASALLLVSQVALASLFGGRDENSYSGGVIYNSGGDPVGSYCTGTPTGGRYESASYSGNSGCASYVPDTDSDGDTMHDTWEDTYSLDKYNSGDRLLDGDNDNCTNACEYARGGAPNDNDSDDDGIPDSDDPDFTGIGSDANGTYKGSNLKQNGISL